MSDMSDLPSEMTAIGIKAPGGPEVLVAERRPVPQPGEGEILIKVAAAGVNRLTSNQFALSVGGRIGRDSSSAM